MITANLLNDWKTAETIDSKYLLEENDVLFARSGSVGRAFVYKNKLGKAIFAGYLIRFKFDPEKINPSFVLYYTFTKNLQIMATINSKNSLHNLT